jgi:hypothetical protein
LQSTLRHSAVALWAAAFVVLGACSVDQRPADITSTIPHSTAQVVMTPVDEAAGDPEFRVFRDNLLAAVIAEDIDAVTTVAHPDIKLSFGGDYGRSAFADLLSANESFNTLTYWQELEEVLRLGGVFRDDGTFCTPYTFCLDVPACKGCGPVDPFEILIATVEKAPIYAAPDAASEIVATVGYAVVRVLDSNEYPWNRIELRSETGEVSAEGFVLPPEFRSPVDYRAIFEKQKSGEWQMTVFIAGD